MPERIGAILDQPMVGPEDGEPIGESREGRPIYAFRLGTGGVRVSLLAGCHADEPVGPRLLRHFVSFLSRQPKDAPLQRYDWWIVPHANPDGAERNCGWHRDDDASYGLIPYLQQVVRELPGDDMEFGFPRNAQDEGARPENRALMRWWRSGDAPFAMHLSLHGTGFAAGPWFLIDPAWRDRTTHLRAQCASHVVELGYTLHDVDRRGEKGFFRLERGFATTPNSSAMRDFFLARGDRATAERFRPSSMETMRAMGGDPLTLVSEMPLFLTPGVGETLGPPDPIADAWKTRIGKWREALRGDGDVAPIEEAVLAKGLRPMPVEDQMALQWALIVAGLEAVSGS